MKPQEKINRDLWHKLTTKYPEQCERVFSQEYCDIEPSFLGFVNFYYHLSQIVPKHFIIVDLGCAYAPQGYYFRKHKEYIGVDTGKTLERFKFDNTTHVTLSIQDYLRRGGKATSEVFAICNYVPNIDTRSIAKVFDNLFVFYPHGEPRRLIREK